MDLRSARGRLRRLRSSSHTRQRPMPTMRSAADLDRRVAIVVAVEALVCVHEISLTRASARRLVCAANGHPDSPDLAGVAQLDLADELARSRAQTRRSSSRALPSAPASRRSGRCRSIAPLPSVPRKTREYSCLIGMFKHAQARRKRPRAAARRPPAIRACAQPRNHASGPAPPADTSMNCADRSRVRR